MTAPTRAAVVLLVLCCVVASAAAETRRVLVFPLQGKLDGALAKAPERLTQVISRSAGLAGAEVILGASSFEDVATLAGCATPDADCLGLVAAQLGANEVVLGSVAPAAGGGLSLSLRLYRDGEVREVAIDLKSGTLDEMVTQLAREAPPLFVGEADRGEPPPPEPPPPGDDAKSVAPPPGPLPPDAPGRRGFARVSTTWWVVAGAGLVLTAGGAYFAASASSTQEEVDRAPTNTTADLERLRALEDEGARDARIGSALLIGGGVAVAVGGAMILWQGLSSPKPERDLGIAVTPVPGGGAALSLELTWP